MKKEIKSKSDPAQAGGTPVPWKINSRDSTNQWIIITDAKGNIVANVNAETGPGLPPMVSTKMPSQANARLIVRAVNSYEALLAALKGVMQLFVGDRCAQNCAGESGRVADQARAAISLSEGGAK